MTARKRLHAGTRIWCASLLFASLLAAGCGGGDDGDTSTPGAPPGTISDGAPGGGQRSPDGVSLPETALRSADGFIAWMASWIGDKDERSEPVRYNRVTPPADERSRAVLLRG